MSSFIDLTGHVFGRWTVETRAGTKNGNVLWKCLCVCGGEKVISGVYLRNGNSKSCGCLKRDVAPTLRETHGMYHHPVYRVWAAAKDRSTRKSDKRWEDYGGRGITMCQEWLDSFEAFWRDMGGSYEHGLTLDRVDNNQGYSKENCRWATNNTQAHNKRKKVGCSSEYLGVSWIKNISKWRASIHFCGVRESLGCFADALTAAIAYDNRSEELYGDRPNRTTKEEDICL